MLSAEAHAELARQIEALSPSAARLESKGVPWETAGTLVKFIKSGAPDLVALKEHGLPLDAAISICEAISKRHARDIRPAPEPLPPLPYSAPDPLPIEPAPTPVPTDDDVDAALWQLAALTDQISRGDACVTLLCRAGYSESTAKEIAHLIRTSTRRSRK